MFRKKYLIQKKIQFLNEKLVLGADHKGKTFDKHFELFKNMFLKEKRKGK